MKTKNSKYNRKKLIEKLAFHIKRQLNPIAAKVHAEQGSDRAQRYRNTEIKQLNLIKRTLEIKLDQLKKQKFLTK